MTIQTGPSHRDAGAGVTPLPVRQILHLRRSGPEPLYYQLAQSLEHAIDSGRIPHGARLPSDPDTAHELRVAVGTVRRAWAYLEGKGVLTRRKKTGTHVC